MTDWRKLKFWLLWVNLLLPSAVVFALPGAIFGEDVAFARSAPLILPLQAFVTFATPYIVAKRLSMPHLKFSPQR